VISKISSKVAKNQFIVNLELKNTIKSATNVSIEFARSYYICRGEICKIIGNPEKIIAKMA